MSERTPGRHGDESTAGTASGRASGRAGDLSAPAAACDAAWALFAGSIRARLVAGLPAEDGHAALSAIIAGLSARGVRDEVLAVASQESALHIDELAPEFDRMVSTLAMFADLARGGSWCRPAISRAADLPVIGPPHDVRSTLAPLGPVVVFGASNFPLAYGTLGGDTASALCAGCPVIIKEHPAQPRTGRLLARLARAAFIDAGLPADMLQYVPNEDERDLGVARALVRHPRVAAIGFTGSRAGGLALDALARERPDGPIPVFAEMGSRNVVVVCPNAARSRGDAIGQELARSLLLRWGQQCTCMGVLLVLGGEEDFERIAAPIRAAITDAEPRRMLSRRVHETYLARMEELRQLGERTGGHLDFTITPSATATTTPAAIIRTDPNTLATGGPAVFDEVFGPLTLAAHIPADMPGRDAERVITDLRRVLRGEPETHAPGLLVASLYADTDDLAAGGVGVPAARELAGIAGRVAFNSPPTGVRVAPGMVHAGPFPATNAPASTAVGPRAVERWCRAICLQNTPENLLPSVLRGSPRADS